MRVIAVQSFADAKGRFHPYGHEFEMEEGSELSSLVAKKILREDDRHLLANDRPPAEGDGS